MTSQNPSRNLAARMARWSAQHRKKAIFGWLGFAVVLFAINMTSPMKKIVFETSGPGESGRADTILYENFRQPAGEEVLIQSDSLTTDDPAFKAAVQAVIAGVSKLDAVAEVKSPFDAENSGFVSRRQALGARADGDPRAFRGRGGQSGRHRRSRRRSAEGKSRALHRLVRREHEQGAPGVVQGRPEARRAVLDPADADHPPGRLRRTRRGRDPAPAGTHVGARHARPRRGHQPGAADVRHRLGDHPLDRARGRGRLHDVLFEAGA